MSLPVREILAAVSCIVLLSLRITSPTELPSGIGPPKVSSTPVKRHQLGRAGERLRLSCPVEAQPAALISWKKDGNVIHQGWERYRIRDEDGQLTIRDLELDDTGVFVCRAVNGFGTVEVKYLVYISPEVNDTAGLPAYFDEGFFQEFHEKGEAPTFSRPDQMRESHLTQGPGSTVRLRCKASGKPRPEVLWFKDGKMLSAESEALQHSEGRWVLKLTHLTTNDDGRYTCRAFNKAGMINFTYTVTVSDAMRSEPVFVAPFLENVTISGGETSSFFCCIRSEIQPHMQWLKQAESQRDQQRVNTTVTVHNRQYHVIKHGVTNTHKDDVFCSRLVIESSVTDDAGIYVCSGTNMAGYIYRHAHLTVITDDDGGSSQPMVILSIFLPIIVTIVVLLVSVVVVICGVVIIARRRRAYGQQCCSVTQQCTTPLISSSQYPLPPPPPPPPNSLDFEHDYAVLESRSSCTTSGCDAAPFKSTRDRTPSTDTRSPRSPVHKASSETPPFQSIGRNQSSYNQHHYERC